MMQWANHPNQARGQRSRVQLSKAIKAIRTTGVGPFVSTKEKEHMH